MVKFQATHTEVGVEEEGKQAGRKEGSQRVLLSNTVITKSVYFVPKERR